MLLVEPVKINTYSSNDTDPAVPLAALTALWSAQQATRPAPARDHLSVLIKQRHHGVGPAKATFTTRRQAAQQATSNKQQATSNKQQAIM